MRKYSLILLVVTISNIANAQQFDLQGHRGARGLMPENTIPGFLKALEYGVSTLELDVVISSDKQVVVSHEPWFNADICLDPNGERLTSKQGRALNIYEMTFAEIQSYDCGSIGNSRYPEQQKMAVSKPLLVQVIEEVEKHINETNGFQVNYNIEIKSNSNTDYKAHPEPGEFSQLVYDLLDPLLPWERITIQSFDERVLRYWNENYNHVKLAYLVESMKAPENTIEELGFEPSIYSPYFKFVKADHITYLHERNIKIIPWTVNSQEDMRDLIDLGVDGLITDYPDRASELGLGTNQK